MLSCTTQESKCDDVCFMVHLAENDEIVLEMKAERGKVTKASLPRACVLAI